MCGRTAQTRHAVRAAAAVLGAAEPRERATESSPAENQDTSSHRFGWSDNFNLSPGMDAMIFWKNDEGEIQSSLKTWGLVTRNGTANKPIPTGMSKHFEGLMFNARSDTLWEKPTFCGLLHKHRSCIIAFDGFFEWKTELGQKQPYYVHSKTSPFLLMAGLWTTVQTCQSDIPSLDTFTVLTTEVCDSLKWLHTRMPVLVRSEALAKEWLSAPSRQVHKQVVDEAQSMSEYDLQWHAVTKQMSSMKFRDPKAILSIPETKSVKAFFLAAAKPGSVSATKSPTNDSHVPPSLKRSTPSTPTAFAVTAPSPAKKAKSTPKKGSIHSFFTSSGNKRK